MQFILKVIKHFHSDSLYRNSIYLMLSTFVMGFFGFFFWILIARFFDTNEVGLATTLISSVTLITSFSHWGLPTTLVKYLPLSKEKNNLINTVVNSILISTLLFSIIYLIFVAFFSPKLIFLSEQISSGILFIFFTLFYSFNGILENVFIAYRSSFYVLIKNIVFSLTKLVLPLILVSYGAWGIFSSVSIGMICGSLIGLVFLWKKFNYRINFIINLNQIKSMAHFSIGNFLANFINGLPTMIMPLLITNQLNPSISAYYYIDLMIANLLYIIPQATTRSLFAEGVSDGKKLNIAIKKSLFIIILLMTPCILMTIFFGQYLLLFFGKKYSDEGIQFLQLLSLAGILVAINNITTTVLLIKNKIIYLVIINIIGASLNLLLAYLLLNYELIGMGFSILISLLITITLNIFIIYKEKLINY